MAERKPRPRPGGNLPNREEDIRFETGQQTVVLRAGRRTGWRYYGTDGEGNHYDMEFYLVEGGIALSDEPTGRRRARTGPQGTAGRQRAWLEGGDWDPEQGIDDDARSPEEKGLRVAEPVMALGAEQVDRVRIGMERREAARGRQALMDARAAERGRDARPVEREEAPPEVRPEETAPEAPPAKAGEG
jgi:hypothetical protein